MKIEDAIRQKSFKSEAHKGMVNLLYTSGYFLGLINETTESFGITRQQYNVLRILRGQHPKSASINLIKDRMLDRMSDSSRLVDRLVVKGLIKKSNCEADRRSVDVSITKKGLELLERMEPSIAAIGEAFDTLSPQELKQFNELLDKIRG
jgi:DNA-binding MarR family transcriptional regulator